MHKPLNNKKLTQFIKSKLAELPQLKQRQQLEDLLDQCENFPFAMQYNSKPYWIIISLCFLVAILGFKLLNTDADFLAILCFIIAVISLMIRQSKVSLLTKFNQQIKSTAMSILYHGKDLSKSECQYIATQFYDFHRCNYHNNIEYGKEIDFHYKKQLMRVKVVTYHGVNKIKKVNRNSKGDENITYEYQHFYRQGVIFPLNFYKNILISTRHLKTAYNATFNVASNTFRHKFHVVGEQQFEIAKFLEPDIIENLLIAGKELSHLTVEFSHSGEMLICQKHTNLLTLDTQFDIKNPDKLKQELFNTSCKNLDYILGFATQLITQMK